MKKEIAIRLTSRYLIPFTYDNCKIKYDEVEQETGTWKVAEKITGKRIFMIISVTLL